MRKVRTTCKHCRATGYIFIEEEKASGLFDLIDEVPHKRKCKKYVQKRSTQPAHLRKKRWVSQERKAAKAIGGRETIASGALNEDGDARQMKGWRAECKRTKTPRYRLRQDVWSKLVTGALENGEEPVLFLDLLDGKHSFVLIRSEKGPTQKSKSVTSTTTFGSVIPVTPSAEVLSASQFTTLREQQENEK